MNSKDIGEVLRILIEHGELSLEKFPQKYNSVIENDIYSDLNTICNSMGLYLSHKDAVFYVSPNSGFKTFSYTNDELKKELGSYFNNEDMYTSLFIVACIVTAFYKEANADPLRRFLKISDLIDIIDNKIMALRDDGKIYDISYEQSYNFDTVVKKWSELQAIKFSQKDSNKTLEYGKNSKRQIVNSTLRFLQQQDLVGTEEVGEDSSIYITERFKAVILEVYNSNDVQNDIYDYIENLKGGDLYG